MKPQTLISIACVIAGCLISIVATYWSMKDRMSEELAEKLRWENRLTAVEAQAEKNREAVWKLESKMP